MLQTKTFLNWLKKFFPFLGLSALYFSFVILVVFLFNYYSPNSAALVQKINPFLLLIRWDSFHYLNIISGEGGSLVFFPLYTWITRIFSLFFSPIFSGFLVSFLSLAIALYFLSKLIKENYNKEISNRSLILLLLFPTAVFFSLIYTESLFLALIVAFFYYAQKKNWLVAAIIGFFACLTRNVGIFLWPVYLVYILTDSYSHLLKKKETWYSLLIPLGLLSYCFYCYLISGDFLAFISGQSGWSQWHIFLWPGATITRFFKYYLLVPIGETGLYNFLRIVVIEGGSFLLLLTATIYWIIKKHWPYATFCLLNTVLFSCMYPMTSVNRYVAVIFPIFIFLAVATQKKDWLFYSLMAVFSLFLIFNIYLLSVGAWVG